MRESKKKAVARRTKTEDAPARELRLSVAARIATGLIASRSQFPFEKIEAEADTIARTSLAVADALIARS